MGSSTSAGSTLAISAGVPATQDEAGYAALTYTEVGMVEKLGPVGPTYAKVEFQPLVGAKQKHKGSVDYGSLSPSMAYDPDDAGQTLLAAAADSNNLYAVKVVYPNGETRYFQSRVFGFPVDAEGADSILMANPTIEINTKPVIVPAG